jgi:hypothetical protein
MCLTERAEYLTDSMNEQCQILCKLLPREFAHCSSAPAPQMADRTLPGL